MVRVAAAKAASVVQQPGLRDGWSDIQYASKPKDSARWIRSRKLGQAAYGPPWAAKRGRPPPASTHGWVTHDDSTMANPPAASGSSAMITPSRHPYGSP